MKSGWVCVYGVLIHYAMYVTQTHNREFPSQGYFRRLDRMLLLGLMASMDTVVLLWPVIKSSVPSLILPWPIGVFVVHTWNVFLTRPCYFLFSPLQRRCCIKSSLQFIVMTFELLNLCPASLSSEEKRKLWFMHEWCTCVEHVQSVRLCDRLRSFGVMGCEGHMLPGVRFSMSDIYWLLYSRVPQ